MIKAIIFDMDGLMIDSEVISYKCYRDFLKNYNIPFTKEDYVNEFPGKPIRLAVQIFNEKYNINCKSEQALKELEILEHQFMEEDGVNLKEGLVDLLTYLKAHGYKTIVATSSIKERALKIINSHHILNYFDDLVFGCEVTRGKPFPDIFLKACEKLDVEPYETLVLEDSEAGIQAAYDAQIPVICIPDMKVPSAPYQKMTTTILNSLNDVIAYLEASL